MSFQDLTLADALTVVDGMRQWDRRVVAAMLGDVGDEAFAVSRWQTDGPAWAVHQDGRPVALGGVSFQNDWAAVCWLIATDEITPQTWRKLARHARKVLANATSPAHEHYRHRVEAYTLGGWDAAAKFAQRFGFAHEGVRRGAGSGGEDLHMWAIVGPVKEKKCRQAM